MALFEGHDRALAVALDGADVLEHFHLALADLGVHSLHLDAEELLDGRLDLGLGRAVGDLEHNLVVLGHERRLLGDDRRDDDVVCGTFARHLKRASSASTAALVSTRLLRRRMS